MPPPDKPPRRFSFLGITAGLGGGGGGGRGEKSKGNTADLPLPQLKLELDREVYRPGDPVTITVEITNRASSCSLLIERLSFEIKGIEKLDTQWFSTAKSSPDSKQRRGEFVFMDYLTPALVSNKGVAYDETKKFVVRTILPSIIPPSYRGATIRYLYYVRSTLRGQYLIVEDGRFSEESIRELPEQESRIPLQIWVTQNGNGLQNDDSETDGIVPTTPIMLDVYWKEMDGDSDWAKVNEPFDGIEDDCESSRDEVSSISSYNTMKENIHTTFGSSLSLQSSTARSSRKDLSLLEGHTTRIPSHMELPQLSVAEISFDSCADVLSPSKKGTVVSPSLRLKQAKPFSPEDESTSSPSVSGTGESGASEGFIRGRSYNIRLDDQVLLRFSPKNSESTYYFSDMIGGTLTFFHEEGTRRCLELFITLEMTETISRRFIHPSRRHAPSITKVYSDHYEVVADLLQTSFLFSIPIDGPMSFSTRHASVHWALRFEFFTSPKNVDWTRYEHPLLIEKREKCEWVLPITVYAPPDSTSAIQAAQNDKSSFSLEEPLWIRT
ncbi:unnamed protein product [Cuscuta epithymum]|uniref:Reduced growth phenotype protein 1 n=1 Tax=Cuscuta epithymum TaxID=186058 RepID=A0AAV0CRM8_9ASTE|nr:unnamed protein product [Cuscuta epithymum]